MRTITIANNKGGVAKTTTATSIAGGLAALGYRTGLIDLDPQANASSTFDVDPNISDNIGKVFLKKKKLSDIVIKTKSKVDLFPGSRHLTDIEKEIISATSRETLLKRAIEKEKLKDFYDFLIIDTPPSLGLLTVNGFCASSEFLVTMQAEYFSHNGLSYILSYAESLKEEVNPELDLLGVVLTKYHENMKAKTIQKIAEEVKKSGVGDRVFKTYIRQCTALMEAQMAGTSIFEFDPKCNGSIDYMNLTKEIIDYYNGKEKGS